MTQLKTTFAGLSLRNPIIISSSSLTNSAEKNKKLELAGAGAIVLKSVFEEQIMMEAHHMATYGSPEGDDYLSTYVRSHALIFFFGLQGKDVDFQCVGACCFHSTGKVCPF